MRRALVDLGVGKAHLDVQGPHELPSPAATWRPAPACTAHQGRASSAVRTCPVLSVDGHGGRLPGPLQGRDALDVVRLGEHVHGLYRGEAESSSDHDIKVPGQGRRIAGDVYDPRGPSSDEGFQYRRVASRPGRVQYDGVRLLVEGVQRLLRLLPH